MKPQNNMHKIAQLPVSYPLQLVLVAYKFKERPHTSVIAKMLMGLEGYPELANANLQEVSDWLNLDPELIGKTLDYLVSSQWIHRPRRSFRNLGEIKVSDIVATSWGKEIFYHRNEDKNETGLFYYNPLTLTKVPQNSPLYKRSQGSVELYLGIPLNPNQLTSTYELKSASPLITPDNLQTHIATRITPAQRQQLAQMMPALAPEFLGESQEFIQVESNEQLQAVFARQAELLAQEQQARQGKKEQAEEKTLAGKEVSHEIQETSQRQPPSTSSSISATPSTIPTPTQTPFKTPSQLSSQPSNQAATQAPRTQVVTTSSGAKVYSSAWSITNLTEMLELGKATNRQLHLVLANSLLFPRLKQKLEDVILSEIQGADWNSDHVIWGEESGMHYRIDLGSSRWVTAPLELNIDDQAKISFSSSDPEFKQWLSYQSPIFLKKQFLEPLIHTALTKLEDQGIDLEAKSTAVEAPTATTATTTIENDAATETTTGTEVGATAPPTSNSATENSLTENSLTENSANSVASEVSFAQAFDSSLQSSPNALLAASIGRENEVKVSELANGHNGNRVGGSGLSSSHATQPQYGTLASLRYSWEELQQQLAGYHHLELTPEDYSHLQFWSQNLKLHNDQEEMQINLQSQVKPGEIGINPADAQLLSLVQEKGTQATVDQVLAELAQDFKTTELYVKDRVLYLPAIYRELVSLHLPPVVTEFKAKMHPSKDKGENYRISGEVSYLDSGVISCYLDNENILLPVQKITQQDAQWFLSTPIFTPEFLKKRIKYIQEQLDNLVSQENQDLGLYEFAGMHSETEVHLEELDDLLRPVSFLFNLLPLSHWVNCLEDLSIEMAEKLYTQVRKIWGKSAHTLELFTNRLTPLETKAQLRRVRKIFPQVPLSITRLVSELQGNVLESGFKAPTDSNVQFKETHKLFKLLAQLQLQRLDLRTVTPDTEKWLDQAEEYTQLLKKSLNESNHHLCTKLDEQLEQRRSWLEEHFTQPQAVSPKQIQAYATAELKHSLGTEEEGEGAGIFEDYPESNANQDNTQITEWMHTAVFDTNYLLNHTDKFARMMEDARVHCVIPQPVFRELDGLKRNPEKTQQVNRVFSIIDELSKFNPDLYQPEEPYLLKLIDANAQDHMDSKILAVAAKYKRTPLTLYTEDGGLKTLANSIGIEVVNW